MPQDPYLCTRYFWTISFTRLLWKITRKLQWKPGKPYSFFSWFADRTRLGSIDGWRWGQGASRDPMVAGKTTVGHKEVQRWGDAQVKRVTSSSISQTEQIWTDGWVLSPFPPSIPFVSVNKISWPQYKVPTSTKWYREEGFEAEFLHLNKTQERTLPWDE